MDNHKKHNGSLQEALSSPDKIFKSPKDVIKTDLSVENKIHILEVWKKDAIELEIADDENMMNSHCKDLLAEILECLRQLENK